jgi:hypothetical protein
VPQYLQAQIEQLRRAPQKPGKRKSGSYSSRWSSSTISLIFFEANVLPDLRQVFLSGPAVLRIVQQQVGQFSPLLNHVNFCQAGNAFLEAVYAMHLAEDNPWAIATSGRMATAAPALKTLGIPPGVPVVTSDQVEYAKPDPDLFLIAAQRLNVPIETSIVVGLSVWDLLAVRRAHALVLLREVKVDGFVCQ